MVPARVLRAAERFRARFDLPAPVVHCDYVNFHDALHQFAGAPPTDDGELTTFELEHAIRGMEHNYADWQNFNRRYGHLFTGMRRT